MTPLETRRAERHQRYRLHAEIGLAASLLVVTGLFRIPFAPSAPTQDIVVENEVVQVEEVEITRQIDAPPPPPAAPPPVEVPDQVEVEEVLMPALELNLSDGANVPPPPPLAPRAAPPPPPAPEPEPETEVFVVVEQMPELIGGIASVQPAYPAMEQMAGIEGRVFLEFVVNEDGTVSDITVMRGVTAGLDGAAIAAVQQARFTPGLQRGRPVKVRMSIPITFRITN